MATIEKKYKTPCLIYDEKCQLCLRFKQALERTKVNEAVFFYALQDNKLYEEFTFLNRDKASQELHFIDIDQQVLVGEKAVEKLIMYDPTVKKFSWLVESKMGQKALNIFYKASDSYRKSLQKCCKSCDH